jgi:hypothetical protein
MRSDGFTRRVVTQIGQKTLLAEFTVSRLNGGFMVSRQEIITYARSLLGTKFHHQGRLPGVGLDCVGVLVAIARKFELTFHDLDGYSRRPDGETLLRELDLCLTRICPCDVKPGDILTFWDGEKGKARHACLATDRGMLHSVIRSRKVVEHIMSEYWQTRLMVCYKFPGVSDETELGEFPWFKLPVVAWPESKVVDPRVIEHVERQVRSMGKRCCE